MVTIKIELNEEQTEQFKALKKSLGLTADTEVVRYSLMAMYKNLFPQAVAEAAT